MSEQQDIKKNLANIFAKKPIPGSSIQEDELPEEETLDSVFGKDKSKKKKKKKEEDSSSKNKGDLSMPQTKDSKNKVVYQEVGSQLHYHTSTGNWEVVEELLDSRPDAIECRSQDGRTILHVASSLGHKKIVLELLAKNVQINSQMENGITPLMLCTAQGQNEIIPILLEHKADITQKSLKDGYTALHLAVMHQQTNGVKLLLEHDKKINPKEPIISNITNNNNEIKSNKKEKKKSSRSSSDNNKKNINISFIDIPSIKGYTALHLAIVENDISMVKLLLDYKANPEALTLRKWTPLHFAAHMGNIDICKLFIDINSNFIYNKNDVSETPMAVALIKNHEHLLEILNDKKGKLKSKSSSKSLLKRKSSFSSSSKRNKKKTNEIKTKETIIIDETQNVSLLDMFKLPEFEGNDGESVIDAISNNPELLQQMKENPEVFLKHIPRDMQIQLVKDVEKNPNLLQEVVEMGKEVLQQVLEEHPEQLLSAMQNPFQLFKKANTPAKLLKLVRQLEENPMCVLKDEFQEDPELFLIKELRNNPRLLFLVVDKVRNTKPELLPLISVVMGIDPSSAKEPEFKEKGITGKMKSKVVKATVNKFVKKMAESEDPDLEKIDLSGRVKISAEQEQELDKFRQFMKADAKDNLKDMGLTGSLYTTEEYYVKIDENGNEIEIPNHNNENDDEPDLPLPIDPDLEIIQKNTDTLDLD